MSMVEKVLNLDRRYLQFLLVTLIAIPLLFPMKLPLEISPETQKGFEFLESLPKGSVILMCYDYSTSGMAEIHPSADAMVQYGMRRGFKFIMISTWDAGPQLIEWSLQDVNAYQKMKYGEDFVNIGYIPGASAGVAAFAKDIHAFIKVDYYGNNLKDLPMMKTITSAKDINLIFHITTGGGFTDWLYFVQGVYGTPMYSAAVASMATQAIPYFKSGQIVGVNNGLRGSAEFEMLTGTYGFGQGGMSSQSFAHVWAVIVIIIGNVLFYMSKRRRPGND